MAEHFNQLLCVKKGRTTGRRSRYLSVVRIGIFGGTGFLPDDFEHHSLSTFRSGTKSAGGNCLIHFFLMLAPLPGALFHVYSMCILMHAAFR